MRRPAALIAIAAFLAGATAADAARPEREPLKARADGFLTASSGQKPPGVALDYVREHPATFALD